MQFDLRHPFHRLTLFLLFVIRFLPRGIGSLWVRGRTR